MNFSYMQSVTLFCMGAMFGGCGGGASPSRRDGSNSDSERNYKFLPEANGQNVLSYTVDLVDGKTVQVRGSIFQGKNQAGDFSWMIKQPQFSQTLFVFNDNEEKFTKFHKKKWGGCWKGSGNAAIRPLQCGENPSAAGIPTGISGKGYSRLNDHVRDVVSRAVAHIRQLVTTKRFDTVLFSQDAKEQTLGTGIFEVDPAVKEYIISCLRHLHCQSN